MRFYIFAKALPTTKQIEFINREEFAKSILDDEELETFLVYIVVLKTLKITIHSSKAAQIIGDNFLQFTALEYDKAPMKLHPKTQIMLTCFYSSC